MSPLAVLLVLVSAGCHAYWNYLLKRVGGSHAFVAVSKASEALVFLPVFLVLLGRAPAGVLEGTALYIVVGTATVLASYVALAAAYRHGELSFSYPIARGGTLVFLPAIGWLALGERLGPLGALAVALIVAGVVVMQLPALTRAGARAFGAHARGPATLYALLMALVLAVGTVWDKYAVREVPLFAYFYGYTALTGVCYAAYVARREGRAALAAAWRAHGGTAVAVGVLNTTSYGLALVALRDGGSTYVIGLRQVSIAVGVALGARLLGEHVSAARRAGVGLVLAGCFLMAWGR